MALALPPPHPDPSGRGSKQAARGRCGHRCSPVRLWSGSRLPPLFSAGSIPPKGVDAVAAAAAEAAAHGCRGVPHCLASPPPGLLVGAVCSFFSLALGFYRKSRDIFILSSTPLLPFLPPPPCICNVRSQRDLPSPPPYPIHHPRGKSVEIKG